MLESLFANFCHQDPGRSFAFGGDVLPFCHRCAGVYVGAVAAAVLMATFGARQRGPAPRGLLALNVLFVLAMGFFGFDLVEQPPGLRYATGVLFGSALVVLSWPLAAARLMGRDLPAWSSGDRLRYAAMLAAALAAPWAALATHARWPAAVFALSGLAGLALILILPNLLLGLLIVRGCRPWRRAVAVGLSVVMIAAEVLLIAGRW